MEYKHIFQCIMSATIIGLSSIFTTQLSHVQNSDRSVIVTWTQKVRTDVGFSAPSIGSIYTYLGISVRVTNVVVDRTSGDFVVVITRLEGSGDGGGYSNSGRQESIGSLTEEPIQTHPNFSSIIQTATTNGVTFDDSNNFVGFNSSATGGLCGVQSYLSPTLSYRRSYTTTVTPSLVNVGRYFGASAIADFPDLVSGANWLLTSINFTSEAGVLNVSEDFRASDSGGWNPYIYKESV